MGYKMMLAEQETIIRYNIDERLVNYYTTVPADRRKMDKRCAEFPDVFKKRRVDEYGAEYTFPMKMVKIGKPPTEARREQGRRITAALREKTTL